MEPATFSPYALTLYNYKLFESFKRLAESPNDPATNIMNLKDLNEFVDNNFAEFHNKSNLMNILPILHYTLQLESKTSSEKIDVSAFILMLMNKYNQSEDDQRVIVQIYYQLLKSLPDQGKQFISMTDDLFQTFYDLLTSCSRLLAANILNCLKVLITELEGIHWLKLMWQKVDAVYNHENLRHKHAQILIYFIDDFLENFENFYKNEALTNTVQLLLVSAEREERKMASYLLRKIIPHTRKRIQDISLWEVDHSEQLYYSWNLYMTVFENLEEKQSHLILPTLETIKNIKLSKIWLDYLYCQLLAHSNSLVIRWTVEYMLDNFVCNELSRGVLKQLLEAANTTNLYNLENYCLSKVKIQSFLNCNLNQFFDTIVEVNWKSVPLHFWIEQLTHNQMKDCEISLDTLVKIAAKVRALQNKVIRGNLITIFEDRFAHQIDALNIKEYFNLIDSLYNVSDSKIYNFSNLAKKIQDFRNHLFELELSKRLYDIVHITEADTFLMEQETLLDIFATIPSEQHGYFRFMFVFDFKKTSKNIEFCSRIYKLSYTFTANHTRVRENASPYIQKLSPEKAEEVFVEEKTIDLYVTVGIITHLTNYDNNSRAELIERGGKSTLLFVCNSIGNVHYFLNVPLFEVIFKKLLKYDNDVRFKAYKWLLKNIDGRNEYIECANRIINNAEDYSALKAFFCSNFDYNDFGFLDEDGPRYFVHNIIHREATHGDARVERRYEYHIGEDQSINFLHHDLVDFILLKKNETLELDFFKYLLRVNADISYEKPRYFENSREHRIKMRISSCILRLLKKSKLSFWHETLWNLVLMEKNQLNVTYLFERIITNCAPDLSEIFKKMKAIRNYSPSQQVSIIVITYMYCINNWSEVEHSINGVIELLLPLTMGANFQVRLYSQLAIYKILENTQEQEITADKILLKSAIHSAIGDQLPDLLQDIRLDVNESNLLDYDIVFYVTNVTFDEVRKVTPEIQQKYSKCRELFAKKLNTTSQETNSEKSIGMHISNVQRKMNTLTDIKPVNDMISYPEFKIKKIKDSEVFVVASLIDKLPNLGGIARTCEVLGIKNLVISSSKHIERDDFKNLSMTAEKGLNISEIKPEKLTDFLISKQIEGYEIVGAEQTANSQSFADFHFPRKCIILLGHEKEGIPANILSVLNHTVEIPQFGIVRSLNVHVTGALFMWEYCKQHILSSQ